MFIYLKCSISKPLCVKGFIHCVSWWWYCVCGHMQSQCVTLPGSCSVAMSQIGLLMLMDCLWETHTASLLYCYTSTLEESDLQHGKLRDSHTHYIITVASGSSWGRRHSAHDDFFRSCLWFEVLLFCRVPLKSMRETDGCGPRVCLFMCLFVRQNKRITRDKGASGLERGMRECVLHILFSNTVSCSCGFCLAELFFSSLHPECRHSRLKMWHQHHTYLLLIVTWLCVRVLVPSYVFLIWFGGIFIFLSIVWQRPKLHRCNYFTTVILPARVALMNLTSPFH